MTDQALLTPVHSEAVPKPAHVPDALVYDYDMYTDAGLLADPHARMADLVRNAPPIFWTPRREGHWVFTSREAVFEASRDWESFSSEMLPREQMEAMRALLPEGAAHIPDLAPITVNPPVHGIYRQPLNLAFSPRRMAMLREDIQTLARDLLGRVVPEGRCEFMSAVAEPLPVQIFLKIFGLPLERQGEYRALVKELSSAGKRDPGSIVASMQRVAATMRETLEARRDAPQDDLISTLWQTDLGGRAATMTDMEDLGVTLFFAGLDTVVNGMGLAARHLATHADLQARLRADPSLCAKASEEMLRRYTFTIPTRMVAADRTYMGAPLRKGDMVHLLLGAANLDPAGCVEPERFDMDRDTAHIAFGAGPHRCVGAHLARVELRIICEELMAVLPPFRIDPDRPPTFHGGHVIGPRTLHLVW